MTCEEQIYSNDYYDFIIRTTDPTVVIPQDVCKQPIEQSFANLYIQREGMPELNAVDYDYNTIPKCFALLDQNALEVSGISRVLNQPTLSLSGQGVLVGFIDTGIAYENAAFRYSDGSSRIVGIWDQSIPGDPPDGFLYGSGYTREQINEALLSPTTRELVPTTDTEGHGTFLAGIAVGSSDITRDFTGAAPMADIAMVKLKTAKPYLKDYFFVSDQIEVYEETDIAAGVYYLQRLAETRREPLVICLALGTNMGSHKGNSVLSSYLDDLGIRSGYVIVLAAGNEANARHHYKGKMTQEQIFDRAQINVGENVKGLIAEVWTEAPDLATVTVTSPTGQRTELTSPRNAASLTHRFIFEETVVEIYFRIFDPITGDQMILIRMIRPTRGLWSIETYPISLFHGEYHIWLPLKEMVEGEVFFVSSDPDNTITIPGNAGVPITVGAYNDSTGSLYLDSGRGFSLNGAVKPDFCAPGVNLTGINVKGDEAEETGTSIAAAITAGAAALFVEWAIEKYGSTTANSVGVKNFLIRGARRDTGRDYPNQEWGYGKLNLYDSFDILR